MDEEKKQEQEGVIKAPASASKPDAEFLDIAETIPKDMLPTKDIDTVLQEYVSLGVDKESPTTLSPATKKFLRGILDDWRRLRDENYLPKEADKVGYLALNDYNRLISLLRLCRNLFRTNNLDNSTILVRMERTASCIDDLLGEETEPNPYDDLVIPREK